MDVTGQVKFDSCGFGLADSFRYVLSHTICHEKPKDKHIAFMANCKWVRSLALLYRGPAGRLGYSHLQR